MIVLNLQSSTTPEQLQRCEEVQRQENLANDHKIQIPGSVPVQHTHSSTEVMPFLEEQVALFSDLLCEKLGIFIHGS